MAKYEWTAYYKGKEGYAESLKVETDDIKEFEKERGAAMMYLQAQEAVTQPRDREPIAATPRPAQTQPAPRAPQAQAQPGVTPACPECGSGMVMRPGGINKNPNSNRFGQSYPGFWSCSTFPACQGKMNA